MTTSHVATKKPPHPDRGAVRLGWLDALRGVAALAVAFHHGTYVYTPNTRAAVLEWFNPGLWGVMVFFLVSGYIIPASLERHGNVRRFWVSRLFRIYPLWVAGAVVLVLLALFGVSPIRGELYRFDPVTATVAHVTMFQDLLTVPNALNVLWTLSYEMAFYLLVVGLFALRLHRRSTAVVSLLLVVAAGLGVLAPVTLLTDAFGAPAVVAAAAVGMAVAIGAAFAGPPSLRMAGMVTGGVLAMALVALNGRNAPWLGVSIVAIMFTGTVIYRAERGEASRWTAWLVCGVVLAATVAQGWWHPGHVEGGAVAWTTTLVLAAVAFAVGLATAKRRTPTWLTMLGTMSFSVYLLHPLLLKVSDATLGRWKEYDNYLPLVVFLLILLPISWAAYTWVEKPMQIKGAALGRRMKSP
ncbi:acyltransferase family protein [Sinosporangium siamense]|uniref:Acyltransferase n=1 Tax=Sinosporangium siamense TaxID=1367973 RepID=A0A919REM4_9ACTN|nr:acyltransferase [Sinosporangium siamense]GII91004.1 acyltransferase [Sinosporangium siamense]